MFAVGEEGMGECIYFFCLSTATYFYFRPLHLSFFSFIPSIKVSIPLLQEQIAKEVRVIIFVRDMLFELAIHTYQNIINLFNQDTEL